MPNAKILMPIGLAEAFMGDSPPSLEFLKTLPYVHDIDRKLLQILMIYGLLLEHPTKDVPARLGVGSATDRNGSQVRARHCLPDRLYKLPVHVLTSIKDEGFEITHLFPIMFIPHESPLAIEILRG